MSKKIVIIESPFKGANGDYAQGKRYALWCLRDSLDRGEAPYASHLLYPQVLDDRNPLHRETGITAGHAYYPVASLVAFYVDLGMSEGMLRAASQLADLQVPAEARNLSDSAILAFNNGYTPEGT